MSYTHLKNGTYSKKQKNNAEIKKTQHRYAFFRGMCLIQYLTKTYVCTVKNELQTPNYMLEKKSKNFNFI